MTKAFARRSGGCGAWSRYGSESNGCHIAAGRRGSRCPLGTWQDGWLVGHSSPIALAEDDRARLYAMDLGKNARGSFAERRQSDSHAGKRLRQQASGRQRERGPLASPSAQKSFRQGNHLRRMLGLGACEPLSRLWSTRCASASMLVHAARCQMQSVASCTPRTFLHRMSVYDISGWHYLSDTTCQIRPHLLYALFIVSRTTIICHSIFHV